MRKNTGMFVLILFGVILMAAMFSACRKQEDPLEIDRTFEYVPTTEPTKGNTETTTESSTAETETTTQTESSTQETSETVEETTTEECAETYFGDENSVFSTLPLFDKGVFEEYFDKMYVEGIKFSQTTQAEYESYLNAVISAGTYVLNSQDVNRAYLANKEGTMCITLLYKDGITLVEAGQNYWDILTFAEEKDEPTKPAEPADNRYGYFDDANSVFSYVPYFTVGTFAGYEAVDRGGKLTFSDVSEADYEAYTEVLMANGYMFGGTMPDGIVSYYTNDKVVITASYSGSVLVLQAVLQ